MYSALLIHLFSVYLPALKGNAFSPRALDEPEKEVEREAENELAPSGSTYAKTSGG